MGGPLGVAALPRDHLGVELEPADRLDQGGATEAGVGLAGELEDGLEGQRGQASRPLGDG